MIKQTMKYLVVLVAFITLNACDNNRGQNGFDTQDKNDNDYENPATYPSDTEHTMPASTPPPTSDTSVNDTGSMRP